MKSIVYVFLIIILLFYPLTSIKADDVSPVDQKIEELKTKISELQNQENSLSKQISLLNSNIELTTLRIDTIKLAIGKLSKEIDELAEEIGRLEVLLTKRLELMLHRIPETYKRQVTPAFGILLFSSDVSDFISRMKYLNRVQEEDAQLLLQLKATQNNFGERKETREKKKTQQETLKKQQEEEQAKLERQKREKQALLTQTKNSEAVYQSLLAQALAEKNAIDRARIEGVKVGPVKKGDVIALVGNTGWNPDPNKSCSTGKHLHFEIQKNGSWIDPAGYLSSKTILDVQDVASGVNWTVGSGSWDWPLQDSIRLTQHFGKTPYSWRYPYSGYIHTGFDMVSSSDTIRAPADGTLYSSSGLCAGSTIIKIKYIEHGDGITSFYLHVQ
ncbi:MAG: peptidase M23B [Candidatus Gottesmanbacteria bacterium GW2011_GWA2_44_17]|uniref:Peptidase M23B n=3 Tax=Candidatus Gottesmaniibacteriota TaxID=1752720 RepID=A0A0G1KFY4_9BACT|nr:MAG: peptidase M23B [Candidatus Gottesmanbacteria bacterium GW2011_GWB1_44_11c]KKT46769.1 MAG: peptidase M23B [Candidatus Gottesmanbacteria bacterium GW2011_GWA2_44_17]HCM82727.1 hypothetical protein [Patescibacteria group bacterium]